MCRIFTYTQSSYSYYIYYFSFLLLFISLFFFFNDTATTEIYTLSLHDALPIWRQTFRQMLPVAVDYFCFPAKQLPRPRLPRSEEHTSELQSRGHLVCRLLLEKKKKKYM